MAAPHIRVARAAATWAPTAGATRTTECGIGITRADGASESEADVDRHRRLYGLLGYEYNVIELTLPGGISMDRDSEGILYGAGVLLQYTARGMVDLRILRVNYEDETARFTTYTRLVTTFCRVREPC